jgi:2-polyprenyl-3-methyl-5-hydroxy-6-metoxy-1,4-benzoquinol methylase
MVRAVTGLRGVHDATTSFRVYTRDAAQLLRPEHLRVEGYGFFSAFVAVIHAHGFEIDEVPINFRPRYGGISKLTRQDLADFARNLPTVRRQVHQIRRQRRTNQTDWVRRSARLRSQDPSAESTFGAAEELHNLASAERFLDWVHGEIEPWLGDRPLEVGAGIGSMTRRIASADPSRRLVALEPATNLFDDLAARTADLTNVEARQCTSQDLLTDDAAGTFTSAVYVSVLEHILDDAAELHTAHKLLAPDGTVVIFVPAMPGLYGSLDFKSGHFRRYDKALLRSVVEQAGFEVVRLHYLEVAGVLPYWVLYRVLNREALDAGSSKVFDSVVVPASKTIQRVLPSPPIGKNLIAVGRRV